MSRGLSRRHLPPFLHTQLYSILPPSLFSPKPPHRGCPDFWGALLIMTASFCPSDFHGTRLSTKIKTEWPYSFQEEAVRQAALSTDLCPCGVSRGRLGTAEFFRVSTDWPSLVATGNPPILLRCRRYGTVSKNTVYKICAYVCAFICILHVFF